MAEAAHRPRPGLVPRRPRASVAGSPSFQDFHARRTPAPPPDVPGASPTTLLLPRCLPEYADADLSRTLLQQCLLDDRASDGAGGPRSSLQERGSWAARAAPGAGGRGGKAASWSARRGAAVWYPGGLAPPGGRESRAGGASFAKSEGCRRRGGAQVSVLSAALRDFKRTGGDGSSVADAVARPGERDRDHLVRLESRASRRDSFKSNRELLGDGEQRPMAVSMPASGIGHVVDNTSATSYSSSVSSSATDSDMSSATSAELLSPDEHKRAMLDRLMQYFLLVHMNRRAHGEEVATTTATPSSASASSSQASGYARRGGVGKGKRPVGRGSHDEESGSDREEDGRPNSKRQKSEKVEQQRLACPFFKRNPQRYKEKRSCVAPGFRTVHRLKEHLYRCHPLPIRCRRCHEIFSSEDQLDGHSQSDTPCPRRQDDDLAEPALEGIGLSQERRLRCRKRSNQTEEEKWRDVYMVCFPDASCVPSPYFEVPSGQPSELVLYEDFVRRELARRVRAELEARIERQWAPVEESLRRQLVDISRDVQLGLLEDFRALRGGHGPPPPTPPPRPRPRPHHDDEPARGGAPMGAVPAAPASPGDRGETPADDGVGGGLVAAGGGPADEFGPAQPRYLEGAGWGADCDMFLLADSPPDPWGSMFPDLDLADGPQLAPAPAHLPVALPLGAYGRGIFAGDGAVAGAGLGRQQLDGPFQDLFGL